LNVVVTIAAMTLAYRALRHVDDSGRLVVRSHWARQAAEETLRRRPAGLRRASRSVAWLNAI
jgi:hypothetical protein